MLGRAKALKTLVKSVHQFGGREVFIQVLNKHGQAFRSLPISTANDLARIVHTAFYDNPLYVETFIQQSESIWKNYFPVFKKSVVQFYNDYLTDY